MFQILWPDFFGSPISSISSDCPVPKSQNTHYKDNAVSQKNHLPWFHSFLFWTPWQLTEYRDCLSLCIHLSFAIFRRAVKKIESTGSNFPSFSRICPHPDIRQSLLSKASHSHPIYKCAFDFHMSYLLEDLKAWFWKIFLFLVIQQK